MKRVSLFILAIIVACKGLQAQERITGGFPINITEAPWQVLLEEILQSLTFEQKLELITEARLMFLEKINNEDFKNLPEFLFSVRIMASILDVEEYEEFITSPNKEVITRFINTGWWFDGIPTIDEVFRITDNYINAKNLRQ